jgi:predicted exporter
VKADGTSTTIIVETIAPAFALAEQETAINFIRNLQLLGMQQITVHGMGAYGVDLQTTIRREATLRSIAATVMALLILFAAYRRPLALLAGILPLLLGALSGLAVIALLFGKIHGITLAFGFTLIGVAIDYPLHLLSHLRGSNQGREVASIWKTMRIGVISTLAAYAAIAAGGSSGLAQMGIFSATGILVAYLATRTLLPDLLGIKTGPAEPATYSLEPILDQRIWLAVLVAGMVILTTVATPHWTNDLSVVSPVAPEKIAEDQRLREQFGAPDIRSLLVLRNPEQQQVLLQTEALAATLELQVEAGTLQAFQTVSQLVPSHARQKERLIQIQAASLTTERLNTIARQYGFRNGAFDAFSNKLSSITAAPTLLDAAAYTGTSLDNVVTGSLYFENDEWVSLVTLYGIQDASAFQASINSAFPAATYVNLKDASQSLMERYRYRVLTMLLLAGGAIIVFLTLSLGLRRRALWVLGTLAAAQVLTLTAGALLLGSLSIFNLIAAVLVAGLGLDYALFYARPEQNETTRQNTGHAVTVCALSTCAAFTILALSSIPVLQSIGVTASIGVAASYLLARFGRKPG